MSSSDEAAALPPAKQYKPTREEVAAVESLAARKKTRPPAPKLKFTKNGKAVSVDQDHPNPATGWLTLLNALGTANDEFADGLISQLVNAGTTGQDFDGKGPNFMLSVIRGIQPRDEAECMLAAQMAVVHVATWLCSPPRSRGEHSTAGQRRAGIQQAGANIRCSDGGAETLSDWRRATGDGSARHGQRGRAGDRRGGDAQPGGVGGDKKSEGQPCGSPTGLAHHATLGAGLPSLRSEDSEREAVRIAGNGQRPL